jgi:G6PDH family F420-dependent oxidoreductase
MAGEIGDGLVSTSPEPELVDTYRDAAGGKGKAIGQLAVCWAETREAAAETAVEWWPTAALKGEATWELPLPRHFEQAVKSARPEDVASAIVCGPDAQEHIEKIEEFRATGYDEVYVHQIGPDQAGFFDFYAREILPAITPSREAA